MSTHEEEDFVPGTIRLLDPNNLDVVQVGQDAVVLLPHPSSDINDPLNWGTWRKRLSLFCLLLYISASFLAVGALYAIFEPLVEQTGLSYAQLNEGTGYTYLFFGIGPLLFQSLSVLIGKRPVYLISLVGQGACMVWAAWTKGNAQWVINRILLGFFASPSFTLCAVSIADLYFFHERGFYMSVYMLWIYLLPLLAPIIGSGIYSALGYKAVLIMAGGLCFISTIICFFFMEETSYTRIHATAPESTSQTLDNSLTEKGELTHQTSIIKGDPEAIITVDQPHSHRQLEGNTKSFVAKMGFQPMRGDVLRTLWLGLVQPVLCGLTLPLVWFGAFQFGIYQVWYNIGNALQSFVLSAPPYNFSAMAVGLTFFGPVIVTIPVSLISGKLSDRLTVYMARRNNGISEPEHKLWLTLPLFVVGPLGLLMMGMGAFYELHWMVFVIGSSILFGLGPLATLLCVNYMFDSFHGIHSSGDSADEAAPFYIGLMLPSMTLAFGFNYAITPWVVDLGYKTWSITATVVFIVSAATSLLMIYYGKSLRRRGAALYLRILKL